MATVTLLALAAPGTVGRAPAAMSSRRPAATKRAGPLATLEVEVPTVEVRVAGKPRFVVADDGRALQAGDTVRTSTTGRAQIAYSDGSLTRLDTGTEYTLVKLSADKGGRRTRGLQTAGQTWHRVERLATNDSYRVEGAHATAAVLGTAFTVGCQSRTQCTFTAVIDSIQLTDSSSRNGTKTVTLTPGQQAIVSDDAIGTVTTLSQEDLLAVPWIVENLLQDQDEDKSSGLGELASQDSPPPTRAASSPVVTPPPPGPTTADGTVATLTTGTTSTPTEPADPPDGTPSDLAPPTSEPPGTETPPPTTTPPPSTTPPAPPLDAAPTAVDDAYSMPEDTLLVIAAPGVLGNDSDADGDPLTTYLTGQAQHGSLTIAADGSFVYFPDHDFSGTDTFTYVAGDGRWGSIPATVTITVLPVPDVPSAGPDEYSTTENTTLVAESSVLANDSDPDGDPLSAELDTDVTTGSLSLAPDGTFTYVPDEGFVGTDSFTYRAFDGALMSSPVLVTIAVEPVEVPPVGPPGAPTDVTAVAGDTRSVVQWAAPASDGGSPITGYTVTAWIANLYPNLSTALTCTTTLLRCTVTGLTNGTPYVFTVTATNGAGVGPASAPSGTSIPNPLVVTISASGAAPQEIAFQDGAIVHLTSPTLVGTGGYRLTNGAGCVGGVNFDNPSGADFDFDLTGLASDMTYYIMLDPYGAQTCVGSAKVYYAGPDVGVG